MKAKIYLSIVSQRKKRRELVNSTGFGKEQVGKHVVVDIVDGGADWQAGQGKARQGGRNFFRAKLSRVGSRYLLNAVATNNNR